MHLYCDSAPDGQGLCVCSYSGGKQPGKWLKPLPSTPPSATTQRSRERGRRETLLQILWSRDGSRVVLIRS